MTRFDELDQQLAARGWHYDSGNEDFRHGERVLGWEDVIGLVAGFTLDELASFQDYQYDELRTRLANAK